jgi:hypothetical protein
VHHPSSVHGNPARLKAAAYKGEARGGGEFSLVDTDLGDSDTRAAKRKRSIRNGKRLVPRCESPEM